MDAVMNRIMHGNADQFLELSSKIDLKTLSELDLSECNRGIYFLMSGKLCVYIGQTDNLLARLATHQRKKAGEFDSVLFFEAPAGCMDAAELDLIKCLTPKLNKTGNPLAIVQNLVGF